MNTFNIGEVALIVKSRHARLTGIECTVLSGLKTRRVIDTDEWVNSYWVEADGKRYLAEPHQLKKLPPKDEPSTWGQGIWQPDGVTDNA